MDREGLKQAIVDVAARLETVEVVTRLRWMIRVNYVGAATQGNAHLVNDDTQSAICGMGPSWRGRWSWHPDRQHCQRCERIYPKLSRAIIVDEQPKGEP